MASRFSSPSCSSSSISSGKRCLAVGDAVGEARLHEPAVAPAGRRADLAGVDQHDVARRVALLGDDRRPQPGVAAADDAQVAALGAHERRVGVGLVDVVVPVGEQLGVGDGVEVPAVDRRRRIASGQRAVYGEPYGDAMDSRHLGEARRRRPQRRAGWVWLGEGAGRRRAPPSPSAVATRRASTQAAAAVGDELRRPGVRRRRRAGRGGVRRGGDRGARWHRHPRHQRRRTAAGQLRRRPTSTPIPPPSTST